MLMASELECEHKHWTYRIWISKKCHSTPGVVIIGVGGLGLMAIQLAKAIMELTDKLGADAVIDFINAYKTGEADMQFLRRRARLVLVRLFGGELKLSLVSMPTRAYREATNFRMNRFLFILWCALATYLLHF
jgi:D-arabinose 1-dehydrogenase-like Zn-dependent alcohol dehydrogenase